MGKKRTVRTPCILFGEGPVDGLFLGWIVQCFSTKLAGKQVTVGHGKGGSAGSILLELKKKYLDIGAAGVPCLVLLDEDRGLDEEANKILKDHPNIRVVLSRPECLDGFLLDLLGDLPPPSQQTSTLLKNRFQDKHLGTREKVQKTFKQKRENLFPSSLLLSRKDVNLILKEIFTFLGLS